MILGQGLLCFNTRNETENSVGLEYRSHREGLIPMAHGLIKGLGRDSNIGTDKTN